MNQPRPFLPVALKGQKLTQKRALVNRKDPFSNENSIKYGPYGSIRNRKSDGSLWILKLISPRTTLVCMNTSNLFRKKSKSGHSWQGLLCLTAKSWLRCSHISQLQICNISWNQICISFEYVFSHLLQTGSKFGHQVTSLALLGSKVGLQVVSLALPNSLGLPYWHYQLVLS